MRERAERRGRLREKRAISRAMALGPRALFVSASRLADFRDNYGVGGKGRQGKRADVGERGENEFVLAVRAHADLAAAEEVLIEPVQLLGKRASQYCSL